MDLVVNIYLRKIYLIMIILDLTKSYENIDIYIV